MILNKLSLTVYLSYLLSSLVISITNKYDIIASGEDIRSVSLPDKTVFVLIRSNNIAQFLLYNDYGVVIQDIGNIKYSNDTTITYNTSGILRALSNELVVLVENTNFHLINPKSGIITYSKFNWDNSTYSTYYRYIGLAFNQNSGFFVISCVVDPLSIFAKFDVNGNELSYHSTSAQYEFLDCSSFEASPYNTICFYVVSSDIYTPKYSLFDSSFSKLTDNASLSSKVLSPGKSDWPTHGFLSVLLEDNNMLLCILKEELSYWIYLFCEALAQDGNTIKQTAHIKAGGAFGDFVATKQCNPYIEYAAIAKISSSKFAASCQKNGDNTTIMISILNLISGSMSFVIEFGSFSNRNKSLTFTNLITFQNSVLGIYYNTDSDGVFQFINYPNCQDYLVTTTAHYYQNTGTLDFSNYVTYGNITGTLKVKVIPEDINDSSLNSVSILSGSNPISSSSSYSLTSLSYNTGSIAGDFRYKFIPEVTYSSTSYSLKYCKLVFKVLPCFTGCFKCTELGTSIDDTKCVSCDTDNNYYPLYDDLSRCYQESSVPVHYYLNTNSHKFELCNDACLKCSSFSSNVDDTKCLSSYCDTANGYYPLFNISTQCYINTATINYYYFDVDQFKACYSGCLTCDTLGTSADNTKCKRCDTSNGYYPFIDDETICYSETTKHENYFLNSDNKYEECFQGCATCNSKGTDISNTKCLTCDNANYYYHLVDDSTQCYHKDSQIDKYYFNGDKFSKCFLGCLTCQQYGTSASDTQCNSCDKTNNYFPLEDNPQQCYYKTNTPNKYFFDTDTFYKCQTGCLTCTQKGSGVDDTQCTSCDVSYLYYPLFNNTSQCYLSSTILDYYYFNSATNKYEKCFNGCLQCTEYGTSSTDTRCSSTKCDIGYTYVTNMTTQCYPTSTFPNHMYLHSDGTYHYCYQSCLTCIEEGTDKDNSKCSSCDLSNGYYPLENDTSLCYSLTTKPENTYKSNSGIISYCFESCKTCSKQGVGSASNCDECKIGYYPLSTNAKTCLNDGLRDIYFSNYFLNFETFKYEKCSNECKICSNSKTGCTECASNYYQKIERETTTTLTFTCLNSNTKPIDYYLDSTTTPFTYKPCHERCVSCSMGGTDLANNCLQCKEGYIIHPLIQSHCVEQCPNYYYIDLDDSNQYKCLDTCGGKYKYFLEENKECVSECLLPNFIYGDQCISQCPENTAPPSEDSNECEELDVCRKKEMNSDIPLSDISLYIDSFAYDYTMDYFNTDKYVTLITHQKKKYIITIFKSEECANSIAFDLIMLDLANCPQRLKEKYKIPDDKPLVILKMDVPRDGQTNQLAYAFYHYLTGERLNLDVCKEEVITVLVPMNNTEGVNITQAKELAEIGVDVYNSSDPFFNDICFEYTAKNGKDVTLEDRRKNYYQNVSFCEEGCEYMGVNLETEEANCSCQVKTDFLAEILDNPITGDFLELINTANFEVIVCYQKVFDFSYWINNIGGWMIMAMIIIQLVFMFIYIHMGLMPIKIYLLQFLKVNPPINNENDNGSEQSNLSSIESIRNNNNINRIIQDKSSESISNEQRNNSISNNEENKSIESNSNNTYLENKNENQSISIRNHSLNFQDERSMNLDVESPDGLVQKKPPKKLLLMVLNHNYLNDNDKFNSFSENNSSKQLNYSNYINTTKKLEEISKQPAIIVTQEVEKKVKKQKKKKKLNIDNLHKNVRKLHPKEKPKTIEGETIQEPEEDFSDGELNEMEMYDAIIYDKRPFCTFYWQQLQEKQDIINTFINIDVLEPFTIKAICFFLNMGLIFTVNGLLYTEDEISAQFYSEEDNSFLYLLKNELSRVVYASMITIVVEFMIDCLFSSKSRIEILIKREKDQNVFREEIMTIMKTMKIKYIVFLVVNFILMLMFWYYCCAFCNCYPNTAMNWLISSFFTWGIILLFPFLLCLVIAILRYLGLKYKWEICYKISNCLTN